MNLKTINSVKLLKIATLLLVVVGGLSLFPHQSFAVSAADWRAGNIIDDSIFFDKNSMTVGEIQAFLNSKVPVCDTSGSKPSEYGGGTRAQYGASKGYPAPFVCLKDYYENPSTKANNLHGSPIPPGGISAAQIIWNVSQQFGISPKVMLVMLHKESDRLMIDDWPWSTQYRTAMGYGCPDSGPNYSANCNPNDYGFYTQMYSAARQFRLYANSPNSYNFVAGRNNTIQYNPDPACGSSVVYIENQATAGLYNYTPYQPNQSALNAGYGTAPCGAYGNRNFWKLYNDWFGSTHGRISWHTTGYKILDPTASYYIDPGNLEPGDRYLVDLAATNTGNATWVKDSPTPFRLGTTNPNGHDSALCDETWYWCGRPTFLKEASVAPGETGHFNFFIRAPYRPGPYREWFKPLAENLAWANDSDHSLGIIVRSPGTYSWHTNGYKLLTEDVSQYVDPGNLRPNTRYYVDIAVTNTGTATWKNTGNTPVRFGTSKPEGHDSFLCDSDSWLWCGRPTNLRQSSVAPGQTGNFNFFIKTPSTPGSFREYFKPLAEYVTWMNESPESLGIRVNP